MTAIGLRGRVKTAIEKLRASGGQKAPRLTTPEIEEMLPLFEKLHDGIGMCWKCDGKGVIQLDNTIGSGYVLRKRQNGKSVYEYKCRQCAGVGIDLSKECQSCGTNFPRLAFRDSYYCTACRPLIEGPLALLPVVEDKAGAKAEEDALVAGESEAAKIEEQRVARIRRIGSPEQSSNLSSTVKNPPGKK